MNKRKQHALKVIHNILKSEEAIEWLHSEKATQIILRRHVCTAILEACVTVVPSIFQLALKVFMTLWTHYRDLLKGELGVILDAVLLNMLESKHCWPEQKIDLIESLSHLFETPVSLVELFYNYDNEIKKRNLFTRLMRSLCQLAEHQNNSYHHTVGTIHAPSPSTSGGGSNTTSNTTSPSSAANSQGFFTTSSLRKSIESDAQLQHIALAASVNVVEALANYLTSPHVATTDNIAERKDILSRSASVVAVSMTETLRGLSSTSSPNAPSSTVAGADTSLESPSHLRSQSWTGDDIQKFLESGPKKKSRDKRMRSSTWVERHIQQKRNEMLLSEALALAHTDSVKACVHLLIRSRGTFVPEEIAQFLYTQNSLDKEEIGDFLSRESDRVMSKVQFDELRQAFLDLIDFTNMDLDSALRHYLVHSCFRLPGEAQKVDRLIQV